MELFTVHLGRFIEPRGLTPPVVLPSYLSSERRQALLTLLASGLGNPPVVRVRWREDTPHLEGNRLYVNGLILDTEGALLLAVVEAEEELRQALAPYGEFEAEWLERAVQHLSAPAPSPWRRDDFGETVDADQWSDNVNALLFEFMADQRRRAAVPFSKSDLARGQLLKCLHQQFSQPQAVESGSRAGKGRSRRKKRAKEFTPAPPPSSLVPQYAVLDRQLAELFHFLGPRPYRAGCVVELLPAYLRFLAHLGLIHPTEMDEALTALRPLSGHLGLALDNYGADLRLVEAVEAAWSEEALAALQEDPALAEARAAPLPTPAPPPPAPTRRPGALQTYTFKVTYLRKPNVWRKIEIAEDQTLDDLHYAIQDAVNFDADHLYSFFMGGRAWDRRTEYASPQAEGRSAAGVKIGDLRLRMKQRFLYLFDYGDEHHFEVQLVGINPDAPKKRYPRVVGKRGKAPSQYGW